jgi:hypothetical protein
LAGSIQNSVVAGWIIKSISNVPSEFARDQSGGCQGAGLRPIRNISFGALRLSGMRNLTTGYEGAHCSKHLWTNGV